MVTLCHKRVHCTLTSTTLSVHHCLICSRKRRETAIGLIKNRGIAFGIRRIESPLWMVCITLHFSLAFFFTLSYRHIQIPSFKVSSCLEKRKKNESTSRTKLAYVSIMPCSSINFRLSWSSFSFLFICITKQIKMIDVFSASTCYKLKVNS